MSFGRASPAASVAWSQSAAPEAMQFVVPRGAGPGDIVSAQAPSGRIVMVRVPPVAAALPGVTVVATVPAGYDGLGTVNGQVDVWLKGRGIKGRWDDDEAEKKEEDDEEEEEAEEALSEPVPDPEQVPAQPQEGGRLGTYHRPRLGARGQVAGSGRPLLVVRNEIVRKGRTDHYIDPVMPPAGASSPSRLLLASVRLALEDRGWVYAPEEAVELMLYYENPDDGTWFPLTDGAYNNIFCKLDLPRPKLQLRAKKTLPTKVEPVDTKNPPGPKFGGTLGGPGPGDVKRVHVDGRWQRTGRSMLKCETCGKLCSTEYDLESHAAKHLSESHQCPWPSCSYKNNRRGPLKLHWKGHMAQSYRLCADGVGRKGETDLIGHFHTIGVGASEMYTPQLHKIHTELYNAIWLKLKPRSAEEQGIYINQLENALSNARAMAAEVHSELVRGVVNPKVLHAAEEVLRELRGEPSAGPEPAGPNHSGPEMAGGTLPWLLRQFGLARHTRRLQEAGLGLEQLLRLLSDDTLGLLDRLETAGVVQPSEQARVLEALALVEEGGVTAEAVSGLERAKKLLVPTGLTIEGLHQAGLMVPDALTQELASAGITDAGERAQLVEALAHATASGVTADAVATGHPMVPSEPVWELVPVPVSWGASTAADLDANAHAKMVPPSLAVEVGGDTVVIGRGSVAAGIHKMQRHISRRHAEVIATVGRDGQVMLEVTAASSSHKLAVRRAAQGKLARNGEEPEAQGGLHVLIEEEEDNAATGALEASASREQIEALLCEGVTEVQLGCLCDLLSVRGRKGVESKRGAVLSAWDEGFPHYLRLAVDAWLCALRQGNGDDAAAAAAAHPDAKLLQGITAQGRRTAVFNGDTLLQDDLTILNSAPGALLRFEEPVVEVLGQGSREVLEHGDVLALLATPAPASVDQEKQLGATIAGKLNYEYRVVNRNHGRLVPASSAVWGLRPTGKAAALSAKGRGAVLRYSSQREEWDIKATELAKQRGAKLYPSAPHVQTWHGTAMGHEGLRVHDIYVGSDREMDAHQARKF